MPPRGAFPTTHWSVVIRAGASDDTAAQAALETLCRSYWYPIYSFVRRQGRAHHEAEDCTQAFLAHLLTHVGIAYARPECGRFRTFLLASVRHFLTDEWHRARAARRGGGQSVLSLDFREADQRFALEPPDPGLTPEQAFDRMWARAMIERAFNEVRSEYERGGRGAVFGELSSYVWNDAACETITARAGQLGMSPHALTMALHRLRRRLGERLRTAIGETVASPGDVDDELRHLIAAATDTRN